MNEENIRRGPRDQIKSNYWNNENQTDSEIENLFSAIQNKKEQLNKQQDLPKQPEMKVEERPKSHRIEPQKQDKKQLDYKKEYQTPPEFINIFKKGRNSQANDDVQSQGSQQKKSGHYRPLNSQENPYREIQKQEEDKGGRDSSSSQNRGLNNSLGHKFKNVFGGRDKKKRDSEEPTTNTSKKQPINLFQKGKDRSNSRQNSDRKEQKDTNSWNQLGNLSSKKDSNQDSHRSTQKQDNPSPQTQSLRQQDNQNQARKSARKIQREELQSSKEEQRDNIHQIQQDKPRKSAKKLDQNQFQYEIQQQKQIKEIDNKLLDDLFSNEPQLLDMDQISPIKSLASPDEKQSKSWNIEKYEQQKNLEGITEAEEEDIVEQDHMQSKSEKLKYPEIQIEKSMTIQSLDRQETQEPEPPKKQKPSPVIHKISTEDLPKQVGRSTAVQPKSKDSGLLHSNQLGVVSQDKQQLRFSAAANLENLEEFKSGKNNSLRELQIMHAWAKKMFAPDKCAEEMILCYFEEDFMEEGLKVNLIKILDEIDEDMKMMKVMMNKLLNPIIRSENRKIAKETLEWAKQLQKRADEHTNILINQFMEKEVNDICFEVLIEQKQVKEAEDLVAQDLMKRVQINLLKDLLSSSKSDIETEIEARKQKDKEEEERRLKEQLEREEEERKLEQMRIEQRKREEELERKRIEDEIRRKQQEEEILRQQEYEQLIFTKAMENSCQSTVELQLSNFVAEIVQECLQQCQQEHQLYQLHLDQHSKKITDSYIQNMIFKEVSTLIGECMEEEERTIEELRKLEQAKIGGQITESMIMEAIGVVLPEIVMETIQEEQDKLNQIKEHRLQVLEQDAGIQQQSIIQNVVEEQIQKIITFAINEEKKLQNFTKSLTDDITARTLTEVINDEVGQIVYQTLMEEQQKQEVREQIEQQLNTDLFENFLQRECKDLCSDTYNILVEQENELQLHSLDIWKKLLFRVIDQESSNIILDTYQEESALAKQRDYQRKVDLHNDATAILNALLLGSLKDMLTNEASSSKKSVQEEKKVEEEKRKIEEENRRMEEERKRRQQEEERKIAEQKRKLEEEQLIIAQERKKFEEERERLLQEEQRKREEAQKQFELERKKKLEEDQLKLAQERQKFEQEKQRQLQEEQKKKEDEIKRQEEAKQKLLMDQEQQRQQEESKQAHMELMEQQNLIVIRGLIQSIVLPEIDREIGNVVTECLGQLQKELQTGSLQLKKIAEKKIIWPVIDNEIVWVITQIYKDHEQDQMNAYQYLRDLKVSVGDVILEERKQRIRKQEEKKKSLQMRMSAKSQQRDDSVKRSQKGKYDSYTPAARQMKNFKEVPKHHTSTNQAMYIGDNLNESLDGKNLKEDDDSWGQIISVNKKKVSKDEDENFDISDSEDAQSLMRHPFDDRNKNVIPETKTKKLKNFDVRNFDQNLPMDQEDTDFNPFIQLTANPEYIDVLCVNCYECVRFNDVNSHSEVCLGVQEEPDDIYNLDIRKSLHKLVKPVEEEEEDVNERIYKLIKAIKNRLVEMQLEDRNCPQADSYSQLHAMAVKIFQNNTDANQLLIMQKIIEDFLDDLRQEQNVKLYVTERMVSMYVFARRLIILNQEKYNQLVRYHMQNTNTWLYETQSQHDNTQYQDLQQLEYQVPGFERRKSQFMIEDIRSEIVSDHPGADTQSEYSDYSAVSAISHNRLFRRANNLNFGTPDSRRPISPYRPPHSRASNDSNIDNDHRFRGNASENNTPSRKSNSQYGAQPIVQRDEEEVDLRKNFFKIAIEQMNKISGRLPPGMTFASLYKEAVASNIDVNQWEKFIIVKLKNAQLQQNQSQKRPQENL